MITFHTVRPLRLGPMNLLVVEEAIVDSTIQPPMLCCSGRKHFRALVFREEGRPFYIDSAGRSLPLAPLLAEIPRLLELLQARQDSGA